MLIVQERQSIPPLFRILLRTTSFALTRERKLHPEVFSTRVDIHVTEQVHV